MNIAVILPAYNEAKNLRAVLSTVTTIAPLTIVVDDGSTDATADAVASFGPRVRVLRHDVNLGKGAALKTGCEAALLLGADILICMDADRQHDPMHIPRFLEVFEKDHVDMVFGARQINNAMPLAALIGNRLLSASINLLFHMFLQDTQSGFRAFTAEAYKKIRWESRGYEVETEMIVRASKAKLSFREIDIDTIYHDQYKGTTFLDGITIMMKILKWKFL